MQVQTPTTSLPTSLNNFPPLFHILNHLPLTRLEGLYKASFTGPRWLQSVGPYALKPVGLGGWWGKQFDGLGQGRNIVYRRDKLQAVMPVRIEERPSLLDGKPCLVVVYPPESRFPWPHIVDELRALPDGRLLGMTIADVKGLRGLPMPFLLAPHDGDAETAVLPPM